MVKYMRKAKKIKKVTSVWAFDTAAATDESTSIHTVENPCTLKRVIIHSSNGEDAFSNNDVHRFGLFFYQAGGSAPASANVAAEEYRWLFYEQGLAKAQSAGGVIIDKDMKIQRKLKDGDVIKVLNYSTAVGYTAGSITLFLDET